MPPELQKVLKQAGVGTPLFLAAGAVGLLIPFIVATTLLTIFLWLDRNVSPQARREISLWLKRRAYQDVDIRNAIVASFDRIFSHPLFRWRAFCRSATLSIGLWLMYDIIWAIKYPSIFKLIDLEFNIFPAWVPILTTIKRVAGYVISDYISLFIVRKRLYAVKKPIYSLLSGLIFGTFVVFMVQFILGLIIRIILWLITVKLTNILYDNFSYYYSFKDFVRVFVHPWGFLYSSASAFLIHIWLLAFALGALGTQLVHRFFHTVR